MLDIARMAKPLPNAVAVVAALNITARGGSIAKAGLSDAPSRDVVRS